MKLINPIVGIDPHKYLVVAGLFFNDPDDRFKLKLYKKYELKQDKEEITAFHSDVVSITQTNDVVFVSEDENGYGKTTTRVLAGLGAQVEKISSNYTYIEKKGTPHTDKSDILDCEYLVKAYLKGAKAKQIKLSFEHDKWLKLKKLCYARYHLANRVTSIKCRINFALYDLLGANYKKFFTPTRFSKDWIEHLLEHFKDDKDLVADLLKLHIDDLIVTENKQKKIEKILKQHTKEPVKKLITIHGVGETIAMQIACILMSWDHKPKLGESIARMAGIAPTMDSSANSDKKSCDHRGDRYLNHLIHLIARIQILKKGSGHLYYTKLRSNGNDQQLAMRKLKFMICRAVYNALYR